MNGPFRISTTGAYPLIAVVLFILLLIFIVPLLILGIAGAAFSRLGFTWIEAVAVIVLMAAGSLVNIPLHTFPAPQNLSGGSGPAVFDAFSGEPVTDGQSRTVLSLNIGGGVIPAAVSAYLLYETGRLDAGSVALPLFACFVIVAIVTFFSTKVLPEWGLKAPLFLPALVALACGVLFAGGAIGLSAGVTAFAGGTLGTMAGATVCGLSKGIRQGIPQVSIGGSGMFGSIVLCALLAALVA